MSIATQITGSSNVAGLSFAQTRSIATDASRVAEVLVPKGAASTLTTRTDNTTGSITGPAGHGIVTAQVVDLYWVGGSRRSVIVGTVAGNVIPISGGQGDNLPVAASAITVAPRVTIDLATLTGSKIKAVAAQAEAVRSTVIIAQANDTEILARVVQSGRVLAWDDEDGTANPFTAVNVGKAYVSHDGIASKKIRVAVALNN